MITPNYTDWQGFYHAFRTKERLMNTTKYIINYTTISGKPLMLDDVFPKYETVQLEDGSFNIVSDEIIKEIPEGAFNGESKLKSISIPEGVETIGYSAFWFCWNLTDVVLPQSLKTIGKSAFSFCSSLNITVPDSVETIEQNAFADVFNVNIKDGTTRVEGSQPKCFNATITEPFIYNEDTSSILACRGNIKTLTVLDSITTVGTRAFRHCNNITEITLPNTITSLQAQSFQDCLNLVKFTTGTGLNYIGETAFNATKLETFVCNAMKTPTLIETTTKVFPTTLTAIKVPESLLEEYKAAEGWSNYADIIQAI